MLSGLVVFGAALAARSFQVSVLEHEGWLAKAADQHADRMELPPIRGTIYDRAGVPLAASREVYRLAVAPREVKDRDALIRKLREHAGLAQAPARRAVEPNQKWRVLPGRYDEQVKEALDRIPGVHFERVMQRFYPHGPLTSEILGMVNLEGQALGGLELEFDSILAGRQGLAVVRHGPSGRPIPGMMLRVTEPVPGRDIRLTIDYELQAIADDALRQALVTTRAAGGELVLLDPQTGELLAAVSQSGDRTASNWSAVTSPYEPGSTIKPFTVAAVLAEGRARLTDSIFGEDGRYPLHGRVVTDVHPYGWLTLGEALRVSSNIVMAKAAQRITAADQYRYLRDFGFGSPTGVLYPSESGGLLRRPAQWSKQSAASLAMGYEVSVTPLQLALAYAALANGGVLMEPRLIREVRSRDGRIERSYAPRAVRRVLAEDVTREIRETLVGAVEVGTGQAAAMGPFKVAGKTGTTRVAAGGQYIQGAYMSTFAGFFPAVDPQLVFVVKLDRPQGAYYGGATAAPVTRATLEAALAARGTPLDRRAIARSVRPLDSGGVARFASARHAEVANGGGAARERAYPAMTPAANGSAPAGSVRLPVPEDAPFTFASAIPVTSSSAEPMAVPEVAGQPVRDAVRALHAAGFHVRVSGAGLVRETVPAAGTAVKPGVIVWIQGSAQPR